MLTFSKNGKEGKWELLTSKQGKTLFSYSISVQFAIEN